MDRTPINRIQFLYLDNSDEPIRPGYSTRTPKRTSSPFCIHSEPTNTRPVLSAASRKLSSASTASTPSRRSHSDSLSRQSSVSTVATSISIPPWEPPTLNQQIAMAPINYGYDLPCEFALLGCNWTFHPEQFESWISHSASHFVGILPPSYTICTFCDRSDGCFQSYGDPHANWRERMIHIGSHLRDLDPKEDMRPDYYVVEHLWANGLLSFEDYTFAMKHTERPPCTGLVPLDYETTKMEMEKEKGLRQQHDLGKEKRQMRNEKRRESRLDPRPSQKARKPHKSSHRERE